LELALKTIGIAIFSISVLVSFGLTSNQAFADVHILPQTCADCDFEFEICKGGDVLAYEQCVIDRDSCRAQLCRAIGGDMIQMQTTSVLAAGAQYTAAWMIPVLVSAIGIGIVIARKF